MEAEFSANSLLKELALRPSQVCFFRPAAGNALKDEAVYTWRQEEKTAVHFILIRAAVFYIYFFAVISDRVPYRSSWRVWHY
jgi:hypothetical protein